MNRKKRVSDAESCEYDTVRRRIDANDEVYSFWIQHWEKHCASRWRYASTPSTAHHQSGSRASRPVVRCFPIDESVYPIRARILTGGK